MVVRGGGSGTGSCGFAAGAETDWGGAPASGPGGAWANVAAGTIRLNAVKAVEAVNLATRAGSIGNSRAFLKANPIFPLPQGMVPALLF